MTATANALRFATRLVRSCRWATAPAPLPRYAPTATAVSRRIHKLRLSPCVSNSYPARERERDPFRAPPALTRRAPAKSLGMWNSTLIRTQSVLSFTTLALALLVARELTPVPLRLPRPPNTLAHK